LEDLGIATAEEVKASKPQATMSSSAGDAHAIGKATS